MSKAQKKQPEQGVIDIDLLEQLSVERPTQKPWSDEEDNIIKQYYGKGNVTTRVLGKMLGRSSGSVSNRAYKLGITSKG